MLRIGLTGGIAAGKSHVANRLVGLGAQLIDADSLAREVVAVGSDGLAALVQAFGDSILDAAGNLNREALGQRVFNDDAARDTLNGITHPRIAALTAQRIAALPDDCILVHDVPLLIEVGYAPSYHGVIVVHASAEVRLQRMVQQRGMSEADARSRMAAQIPDQQRLAAADVVIDNETDLDRTDEAIHDIWTRWVQPFAAALGGQADSAVVGALAVPPSWWRSQGLREREQRRLVHRGVQAAIDRRDPLALVAPAVASEVILRELGWARQEDSSSAPEAVWCSLHPFSPLSLHCR